MADRVEFTWSNWKPTFSMDLDSVYKSIWLGWWLITWCVPPHRKWWEIRDFKILLMPD